MELLNIRKLQVDYPGFSLRVHNLKMEKGINLLIGPNGAGKTTLIESVLGLRKTSEHDVEWEDKKIDLPLDVPFKENLAYMQSSPFLFKQKDIAYHKRMWSALYPNFDMAGFDQWVQVFKIPVRNAMSELSSGQRRLLSIALTLAYSPKLMLLDEPFAFLDVKQSAAVLEGIRIHTDSNPDSVAVVSSHLVHWLNKFSFPATCLQQGKVIASGLIKEEYESFF